MAYGLGLRIEGYECESARILDDQDAVEELLKTAINVAGMTLMAGPFTAREPSRDIGKGPGVTSCALLFESHVVIHTYPEQRWFLFEMTSCKEFDPERLINLLKAWASCKTISTHEAIGHKFPEPDKA